jgi:hypothetical protein
MFGEEYKLWSSPLCRFIQSPVTSCFLDANIILSTVLPRSRGSSVSVGSDYGLDDRGSISDRGRGFFLSLSVQTGSGAHPTFCPMGTWGPFPGGKARPGLDADHSPPSSAEVKNE